MIDGTGVTGSTVRQPRPGLVAANLAGAAIAGALVAIGTFIFAKRSWRLARVVQLLPFLVVLGWAALIFLSPMQRQR